MITMSLKIKTISTWLSEIVYNHIYIKKLHIFNPVWSILLILDVDSIWRSSKMFTLVFDLLQTVISKLCFPLWKKLLETKNFWCLIKLNTGFHYLISYYLELILWLVSITKSTSSKKGKKRANSLLQVRTFWLKKVNIYCLQPLQKLFQGYSLYLKWHSLTNWKVSQIITLLEW